MKRKWVVLATVMTAFVFLCGAALAAAVTPGDVPRMDKKELKEKLGDPNVIIYDVRIPENYKKGNFKIKGAVRQLPDKIDEWAAGLDKKKTYVLYCLKENEATSAEVGAKMMNMGFKKVYVLKGGFFEWLKAKYPFDKK